MPSGPPRRCDCGECKVCLKREYDRRRREANPGANAARCKLYYDENRERIRTYWHEFYLRNREQKIAQVGAYYAARRREDPDGFRAVINARTKRWGESHPEALKAQRQLQRAVRAGRVEKQPCEECGSPAEAHHDDYRKPLDVRWLCRKHHKAVHMAARS